MIEKELNAEALILEAAKRVFQRKGFEGARMQEIADEAKINKALLHYYYRSKDKLFDAVFYDAFLQFMPKISTIINAQKPLFEKIEVFVHTYISLLQENPYIPGFVINELNRDPQKVVEMIKGVGAKPELLAEQIKKEIEKGNINPIDPQQLIINMLAMCLFPFIGRSIIQGFLFNNNKEAYDAFLEDRKKEVTEFIINSIRKK